MQEGGPTTECAVFGTIAAAVGVEHLAAARDGGVQSHERDSVEKTAPARGGLVGSLIGDANPWIEVGVQNVHEQIHESVDRGGEQNKPLDDRIIAGGDRLN